MTKQRAKRYGSRSEAERDHPRLNTDNPVPLATFTDLLGEYEFPKAEHIRCQLIDQKGKCHELHGWGWIAQLADRSEGYIGHRCAEKHFEDDPRFAELFKRAAARVTQEITIGRLVSALRSLLEQPQLPEALNNLKRRWADLYQRATNLPAQLSDPLRKELAARKGNANVMIRVIYVEIEIDEKTKRERKISRPQQVRWGVLNGLQALDSKPLGKVGQRLTDAEIALQQAVASEDQPESSLAKWVGALDYVKRAEEDLRKYEATLAAFSRPENLKLFWMLFRDQFDQRAAVRAALEMTSRKRATDTEVTAARDAWASELKAAHEGRDIEIVG
jgi:hypothetical protein